MIIMVRTLTADEIVARDSDIVPAVGRRMKGGFHYCKPQEPHFVVSLPAFLYGAEIEKPKGSGSFQIPGLRSAV
jgi:hypothetical protein